MPVCEKCGAEGARDISGKAGRLAWLQSTYNSSSEERKSVLADRIMDLHLEREKLLCEGCATCGCCYLAVDHLIDCAICGAPSCHSCSLPALRVDERGSIIPESDDGSVLCSRCNPPSGGRNAGMGLPFPAQPLCVG
jgi:hypothetical protein